MGRTWLAAIDLRRLHDSKLLDSEQLASALMPVPPLLSIITKSYLSFHATSAAESIPDGMVPALQLQGILSIEQHELFEPYVNVCSRSQLQLDEIGDRAKSRWELSVVSALICATCSAGWGCFIAAS
jgi:hypothetical protein